MVPPLISSLSSKSRLAPTAAPHPGTSPPPLTTEGATIRREARPATSLDSAAAAPLRYGSIVPGGGKAMTATVSTDAKSPAWAHELYDLLRRHNVTQFAYVPDAGHRVLIDRSLADSGVKSVPLTTEEEGVALMAGADLGGARAVLLMQSSGVG